MLIGCRALPPCSSQLPTHGQITNPEKSPNMKYTTTKPQRGGCFASAAGEERPRGLQTYPREAGEASELNSQNGSRALIGRRHSRTSIATRLGSTSACPRLLVFKHTITLLQTQPFRRVSTRPPPVWAVWKQFGRPRGRTPWSAPKLEG